MLDLARVTHRYGDLAALDNLSLSVATGATGLVGVNGAGKTTLLSVASGALRPTAGAVSVLGASPYERSTRAAALRGVALMPQSLDVPEHLTALEAVSYITWMRGARWRDATRAATTALDEVGLSDRARSRVRELSGGMKRRLALAQAIALRPKVLLLDEPTTGLDPEHRRGVLDLIGALDVTLIMSSHIIEDIAAICDSVVVIHAGQMRFSGSVADLLARAPDPSSPRALEDAFVATIGTAAHP